MELLALDLDGTLLNSSRAIPDENIKALRYAADKGINITICSGRPFSSVKVYASRIGVNVPVVVTNGAQVRALDGTILYENSMCGENCRLLINIAKKLDLQINVYAGNEIYTNSSNSIIEYYEGINIKLSDEFRCEIVITQDIMAEIEKRKLTILKVEILSIRDEVREKLKELIADIPNISTVGSWVHSIEVLNTTASKGVGLKELARILQIDAQNIMACGDYNNDITMLKFAGTSVAMGNADEPTKSSAKYITGTNDDCGVAKAIYKFIY